MSIDALNLEDLTRILIEPKNSLIQQMQWLFEADGVELEFEDTAILAIAQTAMDRNIGARGLKSIMEHALMPTMYSLYDMRRQGISKIRVTKDTILDNKEPEQIKP